MKKLYASIGLLSVALIAYQIVLMYLFSITQWYHFAYMVIAIALLGFGTSGTVLAFSRTWFIDRSSELIPFCMFLSGITMIIAIPVSQTKFFRFDSQLILFDQEQILPLSLTYLLFFIPFLFGAMAIGLAFIKNPGDIGRLYCANLLGSGAGGGIAVVLLWILFPHHLAAFSALLPLVSGFLILPKHKRKELFSIGILSLIVLAVLVRQGVRLPQFTMSQYKEMSKSLLLPDAQIVISKTSPDGLVQVVQSPVMRFAPGLSLNYHSEVPKQIALFNNGDRYGGIIRWSKSDTSHILDYTTFALPYVLQHHNHVLILHAGTGIEVAQAITRGALSVTAVEPHHTIVSLVKNEYREMTDSLFHDQRVSMMTVDPRSFLLRDTSTYELILFPMIDAFGGTMGLKAVKEQYGLTKESVTQMWKKLSPDGIISFSSWMDFPIRNPLKVLATLTEVLEEQGIRELTHHIAAVRSWGTITFIAKRSPFTEQDIENIRLFCTAMLFDPAILPAIGIVERTRYNAIQETDFFTLLDGILSDRSTSRLRPDGRRLDSSRSIDPSGVFDRNDIYERYGFDVRPTTDDRPYFSQFLRWKTLPYLRQIYGDRSLPFLEIGYLIVFVTFVQVFFLSLVLIILPLFKIGWKSSGKTWTVLFFGMLGLGYMFVEIVLINQFTLYFGHPIYAAAAVISLMLISSGFGSYFSRQWSITNVTLRNITGAIVFMIIVYAFVLMPILIFTISLPFGIKIVLSLLLIAPPAFVMGIPFPLGLRLLSQRHEDQIPWAWGINGCLSVIATVLSLIASVELGFFVTMILSAGFYGTAMISNFIVK